MINLQESMEAIAFQKNSTFFKDITELFAQAMKAESENELNAVLSKITAETLEITGIWMEPRQVKAGGFLAPYIVNIRIPDLNVVSPLNEGAVKRLRKFDVEGMTIQQVISGTIDMKTGKVSGFFSKIRHDFDFSRSLFDGHFTPDEVAGLYFHEVAHAWVNFKYLGESMATNVVLAEVVGQMDTQATIEKKYAVGLAALKLAGIDKRPPLDVDSSEITALVLQGQVARMQKEADTRWYDRRLAEYLADQWAARWMIGSALARALAKLERKKGIFAQAGYDPKWLGLTYNLMNLYGFPFSAAAGGVTNLVVKGLATIAKDFAWSFGFNVVAELIGDDTHLDVTQRIQQQRREIVTMLKDRDLPKDMVDTALAEIKAIDEELSQVHPFSDVLGKVSRYVIDLFNGNKKMSDELAKEELANNRLYELSAMLKR